MKVQVISARLNGIDIPPGEVVDIDDALAVRWIQKGLARSPGPGRPPKSEDEALVKMSRKKLISLADEIGVDIPNPKNASKKDIIALIKASKESGSSDEQLEEESDEGIEPAKEVTEKEEA